VRDLPYRIWTGDKFSTHFFGCFKQILRWYWSSHDRFFKIALSSHARAIKIQTDCQFSFDLCR
jgi:hypothetical protein